jgi:protoporphyrinogen/coproporphyrinogen III oxidase
MARGVTDRVEALVIGGGISGLVCAYALQKAGIDVLCLEASDRPGGSIRTERHDGYLLELGPQSFTGTAELFELFADLNIESEIVEAPAKAHRYVLIDGELRAVPMSPPAFLTSGLFSFGTTLSIARDLLGRTQPPDHDESIADFVRRKFSAELLDRLVGPFVSGVYAGDPERLSLRSAFPTLYQAEKSSGSVIRGSIRDAKAKAKPSGTVPASIQPARSGRTLLNFREGTETLTRALATKLGDRFRPNVNVTDITFPAIGSQQRFSVKVRAANHSGETETILANHLIVATPVEAGAQLVRSLSPGMSFDLSQIEYAPIAVVSLGYPRESVEDPLQGFGFLVPRSAGIRLLGTVWNSSLFPNRAPKDHVLLTSFVGGATDVDAVDLSKDDLATLVDRELGPILRIKSAPNRFTFSKTTVYSSALPQYNVGYADRLWAIEQARFAIPNLHLVGNYLRGPSIGSCIEQSLAVAQQIISPRSH